MKYNLILANKSQQVFLGIIPLDSSSERLLSVTVTMVMSIPLISHFLGLFLVNLSVQRLHCQLCSGSLGNFGIFAITMELAPENL